MYTNHTETQWKAKNIYVDSIIAFIRTNQVLKDALTVVTTIGDLYVASNKSYVRNVDFIRHTTKYHQPVIMKQDAANITFTPTQSIPSISTNTHKIENTTAVLNGTTDWESILTRDLGLSSDEENLTPTKVSISTHPH